MVIRLNGIQICASSQRETLRKWQVYVKKRSPYNGDQGSKGMLWILTPSVCALWVSSIHQMGKFVPMIDWQVFQIRAVSGIECWLAVMRQSGLSPWSRQKMLWHNLVAGPTEDEKSFRGQKVWSFIDTSTGQHKLTWRALLLPLHFKNHFHWLY